MTREKKDDSGYVSQHGSNTHVMPSCLTHGSLFSGIGGFDLAAQWMNWTNVFQCEKDEWCRKILAKNFPQSKQYADIKDFNGKEYTGTIDVISGGFPCQPFSVAGQRKGKDDDRYLWEEMLRVVGEIKPTYVIGENVTVKQDNRRWDWVKQLMCQVADQPIVIDAHENVTNVIFQY